MFPEQKYIDVLNIILNFAQLMPKDWDTLEQLRDELIKDQANLPKPDNHKPTLGEDIPNLHLKK